MLDEKRRWAVKKILSELPPTPGPDPDRASSPQSRNPTIKQLASSPARVRPRKVGGSKGISKVSSKRTTLTKRSPGSLTSLSPDCLSSKKRSVRRGNAMEDTIDVLYEPGIRQADPTSATETGQRSTTPEDSPLVTSPIATLAAEMKTSLPLILPMTFTLPPPSPASSLAALDLGSISPNANGLVPPLSTVPSFDAIPLAQSARPPVARPHIFSSPRTPRPLVNTHLKHAYSPARPSPLSRILMIADSPPSSPFLRPVPPIEKEIKDVAHPESHTHIVMGALSTRLLARVVKSEAPIDEPSPLRERTGADLNGSLCGGTVVAGTPEESKSTSYNERRLTAREKGKARAVPVLNGVTVTEKENVETLTKVCHSGKPKPANIQAKPKFAGSETRSIAEPVKTSFTLSSINETATRKGMSSGPSRRAAQVSTGLTDRTMMRAGVARKVPIGSINAGKMGVRKV